MPVLVRGWFRLVAAVRMRAGPSQMTDAGRQSYWRALARFAGIATRARRRCLTRTVCEIRSASERAAHQRRAFSVIDQRDFAEQRCRQIRELRSLANREAENTLENR